MTQLLVLNSHKITENINLKETISLCYKELNLFIVNLQYVFSQHNKHQKINMLPQHVSTPQSHHQAEYLRTIK